MEYRNPLQLRRNSNPFSPSAWLAFQQKLAPSAANTMPKRTLVEKIQGAGCKKSEGLTSAVSLLRLLLIFHRRRPQDAGHRHLLLLASQDRANSQQRGRNVLTSGQNGQKGTRAGTVGGMAISKANYMRF